MDLYRELAAVSGEENVLRDEPMSRHTTFRIGGPADYFVTPKDKGEIKKIIKFCRKEQVPFYVIGNGSNLLVGDRGYRGVIIQIFKQMSKIEVDGERIMAQAGALLSKLAAAALDASLTGFEFASGIPGTLGGALRMNAGAYGGEMKQVVLSADVLTPAGDFITLSVDELGMGYRTSIISKNDYVVIDALLQLFVRRLRLRQRRHALHVHRLRVQHDADDHPGKVSLRLLKRNHTAQYPRYYKRCLSNDKLGRCYILS